ncbi:MAG: hypothetical protein JNL28_13035 [Planctomycetes bacterium]|nr:hypothetical protein [Planctomycetota bacterium]
MSNHRYVTSGNALPLVLVLALAACRSNGDAIEASADSAEAKASAAALTAEATPQDAGGTVRPGSQLAQDVEKLSLAEQRKAFLIQQHIQNAETYLKNLMFAEAELEAAAALDLEPMNLRAKDLRAESIRMRGGDPGTARTITQDMEQQYALKVQQMKADVQDALAKSRVLVARNDYQGAITELEIANNLVRFAPYSVNWQGLDTEAKSMLQTVKDQRLSAEKASEEAARRKATEALREKEATLRDRKTAQVNGILDRAIGAFQAGEYEDAEDFAQQALDKDPRNEQAKDIREASFRAGRKAVKASYVEKKNEQYRRWRESMKELEIPWTPELTLPSAERWSEITDLRSRRRGIDLSQKVSESERALRDLLRNTPVQNVAAKDEESLIRVIDGLRVQSGLPLVVDPAADAAAKSNATVFNFNFDNRLTAEQVLNLITKMAGDQVTWTVRHDAVLITTKEKARDKPIIYNHDVQDLVFGLTDFMGPRIDRLRLIDQMQDDDGGGPFGGIGEKPKIIEPSDLSTLIQENVAVGTWQDAGVSIEAAEGFILINHTPEVQLQVREFLNDLRRFSSSLVTIESKFLSVASNWIQEIGVDFRGLDNIDVTDVTNGLEDQASRGLDNGGTGTAGQNSAGHPSAGIFYDDGQDGDFRATTQNFFGSNLGNALSTIGGATFQLGFLDQLNLSAILRAVEKSSNIELVNDQVLSVHNTQRAYVTVINQRAYIQDFDVEVAQFQAVADPQINVLNEGVVLDVRPTIHHNRKYLTLEIQPTVAKVVALRDFSSTLGGNTSPIQFQLPELQVQSVFTSAVIPDGGSIMLGGLSSIRNIERRAEVPWIAKIPIIGFFFKQEGYSDENKSLMILIRARITDVRDELKKIEAR